ncbi:EAL domain-containing protein [Cellulomonas fimi]|uniref:EAL domain-containing protein n=1 Tax=Cellulomonas fimi TaxID=1708 RepID=A0A7Y0LZR1_CELFI|nr:EAL domain-containing protein [Cellulomonas fimi]NMR19747.1 EAL domain-containing protein [Cellulomonas fimi]
MQESVEHPALAHLRPGAGPTPLAGGASVPVAVEAPQRPVAVEHLPVPRVPAVPAARNVPAAPTVRASRTADPAGLVLGLLNRGVDPMAPELRTALPGGQLRLHYQVQRDVATGAVVSLEALIRWAHPEQGLLAPAAFLPVAQDHGLMGLIDSWALTHACRDGAWLSTCGFPVEIAVNLSSAQLTSPDVVPTVEGAARAAELPSGLLTLELSMTDALAHVFAARDVASSMARRGVRVSVADVGLGARSPERVGHLGAGEFKLDRAFVATLGDPASGPFAQLKDIVDAAHYQGVRVVAEGIENQAQLDAVRTAGCDRVQGYFVGRPAPLEDLAEVLAQPAAGWS